ncbi:uncharacterized protein LOC142350736 isoform X2 [Convolutriloba macropyga]
MIVCSAMHHYRSGRSTKDLANMESLVFWVSNGLETFGKKCRRYSKYYCLDSYRTPAAEDEDTNTRSPGGMDPRATMAWFGVLIRDKWQIINMIEPDEPNFCCEGQSMKYLFFGQLRKKWSPEQYMEKLMDYSDEDKPLNFLTAVYLEIACKNLIIELGFGPGNFTRNQNSIVHGAPFIIMGGEEFPEYGIPGLSTATFPFENPGQNLTFHWFKHNIMCKEHPWICGHIPEISSRRDKKLEKSSKKEGGSKKSRRKKGSSQASKSRR